MYSESIERRSFHSEPVRGLRLAHLEVALAPRSDAHLYSSFEHGVVGVFLPTYQTLPIGSSLELTVYLPGDRVFECEVEVRWAKEAREDEGVWPGLGLEFVRLSAQHRQWLLEFAEERRPLFYPE